MTLANSVQILARDVNEALGPGLRENAYHEGLKVALADDGIQFTSEATIPVLYRGFPVARMHPDLVVGDDERLLMELKVDRDGSAQLARYIDYAQRNEMDNIAGGIMVNFGSGITVKELDLNGDSELLLRTDS